MIEILVIDYQSKFSLDLLSMLVNIKGFTSPRGRNGFNKTFSEECGNSCLAKAKCSRFISLLLTFVELTSSFFLKGRCMKKSGFIHKGFGFFKRKSEWLFA